MKKSAFLLSLLMLLVPFAGCASSDLDKHLIENRTVTIEPGGAAQALVYVFEDSRETWAKEAFDQGYTDSDGNLRYETLEDAIEARGGNETHDWSGREYGTWSNCDIELPECDARNAGGLEYELLALEVEIVEGKSFHRPASLDVLWLDYSNMIRVNNVGWDSPLVHPSKGLSKNGISSSWASGPVSTPEASCHDPEVWSLDDYYQGEDIPFLKCPVLDTHDHFVVYLMNTGTTGITIEYSIFGWV
ncbi:MAG: hypothetical protein P8Q45_05135 [Candidatus Thalassarchaeaceae archaeon]|nr:hypothetical protein [Candidatus Thalassarchaeaceae archaeon]